MAIVPGGITGFEFHQIPQRIKQIDHFRMQRVKNAAKFARPCNRDGTKR